MCWGKEGGGVRGGGMGKYQLMDLHVFVLQLRARGVPAHDIDRGEHLLVCTQPWEEREVSMGVRGGCQ